MDKQALINEKLAYDWSQDNFDHIRLTLIEDAEQFISLDVTGVEYNGTFSVQDMDVFITNGDDGWMELRDQSLIQFFTQLCDIETLIINALDKERGIYVDNVQF
jgi:hypothetical protein